MFSGYRKKVSLERVIVTFCVGLFISKASVFHH